MVLEEQRRSHYRGLQVLVSQPMSRLTRVQADGDYSYLRVFIGRALTRMNYARCIEYDKIMEARNLETKTSTRASHLPTPLKILTLMTHT